jgi:hypothetical protein
MNKFLASPPRENHKIEIRCNNGNKNGLNNLNIFKKLKLIEEKLRKTLNNTSLKNLKQKKIDTNSTTLVMKTKKQQQLDKNNKTIIKNKFSKLPSITTTVKSKSTTTAIESATDDYIIAEDLLNKELNELELSEEYAHLNEKNDEAKAPLPEINQPNARKIDNKQQQTGTNNFKPINNNADHEWIKALGIPNEHPDSANHKDKDLLAAFLPIEGQNLGNNQLAQLNARSGAAAQKQDLKLKENESAPGSNTGNI